MSDSSLEYILVGYSGHGFVVAEAALSAELNLTSYIDIKEKEFNPFTLRYLGSEESIIMKSHYRFLLGIGDNLIREKAALKIKNRGGIITALYHPKANISEYVTMGDGVFVARGACINPFAVIGDNAIINTAAVVEHECNIGANCHIAPGAVLAGSVTVGERCFIGANSVIKQGVKIASNVTIGAGSVVLSDIKEKGVYVGVPIRKIK